VTVTKRNRKYGGMAFPLLIREVQKTVFMSKTFHGFPQASYRNIIFCFWYSFLLEAE
jgi:hypothetical protein